MWKGNSAETIFPNSDAVHSPDTSITYNAMQSLGTPSLAIDDP